MTARYFQRVNDLIVTRPITAGEDALALQVFECWMFTVGWKFAQMAGRDFAGNWSLK